LCDLDEFKTYNDRFGHLAGDTVLIVVARKIREVLRRGDTLYRYGGEEFLVLLPEQSLAEATLAMERVRSAVEHLHLDGSATPGKALVTMSVGVSMLSGTPTETMDRWLGRADAALYVAKSRGRNRVVTDP
jgi:two-component system cell cycle response regulator